ncbi:hypothetical protein [uncultured Lamprocystis sp.]|uniref:hypothetical protein n=1 Tax=uncultured Lamprocystis sp. TaxID=543132 RepID=UPI0025E1C53E|nr:hypothetical protein [uncultured Lamprocystis sp.]
MASPRRHRRHHGPARPRGLSARRWPPRPAAVHPDSPIYRDCLLAMAAAERASRDGAQIVLLTARPSGQITTSWSHP